MTRGRFSRLSNDDLHDSNDAVLLAIHDENEDNQFKHVEYHYP